MKSNTDPILITGQQAIADILGVSKPTVYRWRRFHGLPVAALPDGTRATTRTLIDAWLLARCEAERG